MLRLLTFVALLLLLAPIITSTNGNTGSCLGHRESRAPRDRPLRCPALAPAGRSTRRAHPLGLVTGPSPAFGRGASSTTRRLWTAAMSPSQGTVFAPGAPTPPDGFLLLTMGHDATGIARVCAPSLDPFVP